MVFCKVGINLMFSICGGMYRCSISHGYNGWFFMCNICRYGDIFIRHDIFVMFPRNACFLIFSISSLILASVYDILC